MSSRSRSHRKKCLRCHDCNPIGHRASVRDEHGKSTLVLSFNVLSLKSLPLDACRFCRLILDALELCWEGWRQRLKIILELVEGSPLSLKLLPTTASEQRESIIIYVPVSDSISRRQRLPWSTLGTALTPESVCGSDKTFTFMKDCLKKSRASKSLRSDSDQTPTRLIHVGSASQPHIRLCRTANRSPCYVALSHCWGTGPSFTTKLRTLAMRKDEILLQELPPLFQDTVRICWALDVQYLWIDSLTIIQDSRHDWATESAKMGAIYANAHFVISATACADSSHRILQPRHQKFTPHYLEYTNRTRKSFDLICRRVVEHHPDHEERLPAEPTGPLMTRAWSLQEQLLCGRAFHFTSSEILFEDRDIFRCECKAMMKGEFTSLGLLSTTLHSSSRPRLFDQWHLLLQKYSRRKLTYASDRLPAISGIAQAFGRATKSDYIAGLWVENLIADLLWSSCVLEAWTGPAKDADTYRAPSFSWASVGLAIDYWLQEDSEHQALAKIVETRTELKSTNVYGEVLNAHIKLRALASPAKVVASGDGDIQEYKICFSGQSKWIVLSQDTTLVEDPVLCTVRRAELGDSFRPFEAEVMCCAIASSPDNCMYGLALGRSLQVPDGWERLGLFNCDLSIFQNAAREDLLVV